MIDTTRLTRKSGDYYFAPRAAVRDRVLLEVAELYDTEVSNRFLGIKPADLPSRYSPESKILATTKYDGEGTFIYFEVGREPEIFSFNAPSGRVRVGLPCLSDLGAKLNAQGVKKTLLRAELYLPETVDGRRCNSADVSRASHSTDAADAGRFHLAVLDVIMLDGKDMRVHQGDFLTIWKLLGEFAGTDAKQLSHRAEGGEVTGAELLAMFESRTGLGLEGLVIRRTDRPEVCKLKPRLSIDAVVVGYVEGEFEGHHGVMSLLTALAYPNADKGLQVQAVARVGSGFNDQDRIDWLARLSSMRTDAPLAMTDSDGRPVRFVKPGIVVEIEAEDALPASEDDVTGQQVFTWADNAWRFDGLATCPRLLFPTFHRLRADKEFSAQAVRLFQLTKREIPAPELINRDLPALEIVAREVYTKEAKGAVAVRKLLITKRPPTAGAFPYVVFWTDYSAGRKTPLEVTTLFAHTEARAQALAAKLLAENVTKGFVLLGSEPVAAATDGEAPKAKKKAAKKAAATEESA
jgi:hypothetical protein